MARPDRGRRAVLLVAGAGAVAALVGFGSTQRGRAATWMSKRWVERLVRDHLAGIDIDSESLAAFAVETVHGHRELRDASAQAEIARGQVWAWFGVRPAAAPQREQLEREVITRFLTGSNFFQVNDPRAERIVYAGLVGACGNVFARFIED